MGKNFIPSNAPLLSMNVEYLGAAGLGGIIEYICATGGHKIEFWPAPERKVMGEVIPKSLIVSSS